MSVRNIHYVITKLINKGVIHRAQHTKNGFKIPSTFSVRPTGEWCLESPASPVTADVQKLQIGNLRCAKIADTQTGLIDKGENCIPSNLPLVGNATSDTRDAKSAPKKSKKRTLQDDPPSLEEWRAKAKEVAPEWTWSAPADVDRGYFYYARMDWCSPKSGIPYRSLGGCIGTCASRWRTEHPADFVEARRRLAAEARQGGIAPVKVPEVTPPPRPAFLAPVAPVSTASLFGGLPGFDAKGLPSSTAMLEEAE